MAGDRVERPCGVLTITGFEAQRVVASARSGVESGLKRAWRSAGSAHMRRTHALVVSTGRNALQPVASLSNCAPGKSRDMAWAF